jgi:hypothetical protein
MRKFQLGDRVLVLWRTEKYPGIVSAVSISNDSERDVAYTMTLEERIKGLTVELNEIRRLTLIGGEAFTVESIVNSSIITQWLSDEYLELDPEYKVDDSGGINLL